MLKLARLFSCCVSPHQERAATLLLMGLDNAGKTSVINALTGSSANDTIPTYGFSSAATTHGGHNLQLYDVGGGRNIRRIWKTYLPEAHGIVFVVDASDSSRLQEAADCLQQIAEEPTMQGKPLLILANKQDVPGALSPEALSKVLQRPSCSDHSCCSTFGCTARDSASADQTADPHLQEGFTWLIQNIDACYDQLNSRVAQEAEQAKQQEQQRMKDRQARVLLAKQQQQQEDEQQSSGEQQEQQGEQQLQAAYKQTESKVLGHSSQGEPSDPEGFTIKAAADVSQDDKEADASVPEPPAAASVLDHCAVDIIGAVEPAHPSSSAMNAHLAGELSTVAAAGAAVSCANQAGSGTAAEVACSRGGNSSLGHLPPGIPRDHEEAGCSGTAAVQSLPETAAAQVQTGTAAAGTITPDTGSAVVGLIEGTLPSVSATSASMNALQLPSASHTSEMEGYQVQAAEEADFVNVGADKQMLRRASSSAVSRPGSGALRAVPSLTAV